MLPESRGGTKLGTKKERTQKVRSFLTCQRIELLSEQLNNFVGEGVSEEDNHGYNENVDSQ